MVTLKNLEKEISQIKERNARVESDKAWETSWTRKLIIFILTYIFMVIFFFIAGLPKPFINSFIPSIAFILSTLTMQIFKQLWLRRQGKNAWK